LATAERELIEETGYRAASIEKLTELAMSPGILNERIHVYLATRLTPGPNALEPGEDIVTKVVAWSEALAMIQRGEIHDAKTVAGLLFCDRFRRSGNDPQERS
jgi:ADP-ribose pyrophosphatase